MKTMVPRDRTGVPGLAFPFAPDTQADFLIDPRPSGRCGAAWSPRGPVAISRAPAGVAH
jgi:hypothetical protein